MDSSGPDTAAITSLTYIGRLADRIAEEHLAIAAHIEFAREHGASWRMIGVALGVSTQAAWEKYRQGGTVGTVLEQDPFPVFGEHAPGHGNHKTVAQYTDCPYCGSSSAAPEHGD